MKLWLSVVVFCLTILNLQGRGFNVVPKEMFSEKRVALVIGNNNYKGDLPKLRNPINDAKAIKNLLKSRGFDVIYKTDVTKRAMKKSLKTFYRKIRKGGVGFLYFAGHGIEVEGKNYLIPIGANIEEKDDAKFEGDYYFIKKEFVENMRGWNDFWISTSNNDSSARGFNLKYAGGNILNKSLYNYLLCVREK